MFVSTDYTYPAAAPSDAAETYAIALKVTSKSSVAKDEDTSVDTGIEYTTAYIPTVGDDYNAIANIVLAKEEGEGDAKKLVEIPASGAEYEMVYNQTEPLTMLSSPTRWAIRSFRSIRLPSRVTGMSSLMLSPYTPAAVGLLLRV